MALIVIDNLPGWGNQKGFSGEIQGVKTDTIMLSITDKIFDHAPGTVIGIPNLVRAKHDIVCTTALFFQRNFGDKEIIIRAGHGHNHRVVLRSEMGIVDLPLVRQQIVIPQLQVLSGKIRAEGSFSFAVQEIQADYCQQKKRYCQQSQ